MIIRTSRYRSRTLRPLVFGFDGSRAFLSKRTGTENYSYQLLLHLAKIDQTNTYYIFLRPGNNIGGDGEWGAPLSTRSDNEDIEWGCEPAGPQSPKLLGWPKNFHFVTIPYPRLWTQMGLAQQTFRENLDVLFVPSHTLPLIRKPGLKTVITVHDLGAEYLPKAHQLKQRLYLKLMTDYQLQSATQIIAVSEATKKDLIEKVHLPKNKISVVYEGFNQKLFQPVKNDTLQDILKQYDLVKDQYFLFIGTIQPRKNLERLIKSYALFLRGDAQESSRRRDHNVSEDGRRDAGAAGPRKKSPPLVLVGSKGWLSDEIYDLPKKLGIEEQVRFLGYIPDEKLPTLYSGAKAFLFPSLFEGFGLPILEAFACGCPVLTSNISSMPEVAGKTAILVNPYSIDEITQGIQQISTNGKQRQKMIQSGFVQVQKFSWEKAARETLKILEKTVNSAR
jgi:glycosyltransferase involved in cell wall biosynthesis